MVAQAAITAVALGALKRHNIIKCGPTGREGCAGGTPWPGPRPCSRLARAAGWRRRMLRTTTCACCSCRRWVAPRRGGRHPGATAAGRCRCARAPRRAHAPALSPRSPAAPRWAAAARGQRAARLWPAAAARAAPAAGQGPMHRAAPVRAVCPPSGSGSADSRPPLLPSPQVNMGEEVNVMIEKLLASVQDEMANSKVGAGARCAGGGPRAGPEGPAGVHAYAPRRSAARMNTPQSCNPRPPPRTPATCRPPPPSLSAAQVSGGTVACRRRRPLLWRAHRLSAPAAAR
jgi:hypothetical protein